MTDERLPKIVALLSGGLDSTTLLYYLQEVGWRPHALAVDYGQRHRFELQAAKAVAEEAEVPLTVCSMMEGLGPVFEQSDSSQVGRKTPVPKGHYADGTMRQTIVPNRNMLLLAVAAAMAEAMGIRTIAYAAHSGDHPIYPDCRPEFILAMRRALWAATDNRVGLVTPFEHFTKATIVRAGHRLHVPFELTYSCYVGYPELRHCGLCGTCVERKEAFQQAGVDDPTVYGDGAAVGPPSES